MALTDEELMLQLNILATKISDNSSMVYKTNAILNKGLNPDFFSGQNTKIVNALNDLAKKTSQAVETANTVAAKVNSMLIDIDDAEKQAAWQELQELMGQSTLVEGLKEILLGNKFQLMLDLNEEDVGKVLSVAKKEDNSLIIQAIDMMANGDDVSNLTAEDIKYNHDVFKLNSIKEALDFILDNCFNEQPMSEVHWNDILDKPEIANDLIISNDKLYLQSENGVIASVDIVSDSDIDEIINQL